MSTGRRCSIRELQDQGKDHGESFTYNWHCRRRSHPVQRMGGVCAMCLTERLSNIICTRRRRLAEPAHSPDHSSSGYRPPLAGAHSQFENSEDIAPNGFHMWKQAHISPRQCDLPDICGVQLEMSARNSSAGSEQSIASLIQREIDEGRHRYSDATAAGSKELALEASNDRREAASTAHAKQQLARSRSYSTNSHFSSLQSTPASYKSNGTSLRNCGDSCRRNTAGVVAGAEQKSGHHALLTKCKSTGSDYIMGNNHHATTKLRSPVVNYVRNLPRFLHKKCTTHMESRHDASHDQSSLNMQADDSVPFMNSCRKANAGGGNFMNRERMCMGIKWFTPASRNLTRRSTSGKGSLSSTSNIRRSSSSACRGHQSLTVKEEVAASSATRANRYSPDLQVGDHAKGVSRCGRLLNFDIVSQMTAGCRAKTSPAVESGQLMGRKNIISAANSNGSVTELPRLSATVDDQFSKVSRCRKAGTERAVVVADQGLAAASRNRGSGHISSSQFCSVTSRAECAPPFYSGHAMMMMEPNLMNHQCQSIGALVSTDAHLMIPSL